MRYRGIFYHTFKKKKISKKKLRKNFVWVTAEKRLNQRRSNVSMSLPLNFSAGDFVFASAPHLFFLNKKRLSHLPLVPRSTRAADPFFCGFVRNAWETPGAIRLYGIQCSWSQVTSFPRRGYHVRSGITPPFPPTYKLPKLLHFFRSWFFESWYKPDSKKQNKTKQKISVILKDHGALGRLVERYRY